MSQDIKVRLNDLEFVAHNLRRINARKKYLIIFFSLIPVAHTRVPPPPFLPILYFYTVRKERSVAGIPRYYTN